MTGENTRLDSCRHGFKFCLQIIHSVVLGQQLNSLRFRFHSPSQGLSDYFWMHRWARVLLSPLVCDSEPHKSTKHFCLWMDV